MYKHNEKQMILPHEFFLPFGGTLNAENRWCKLALLIPWDVVEEKYAKNFPNLHRGKEAYSVRMALGSLIIQSRTGLSDRELLINITENPYMQYLLGLHAFIDKPPYNASLLVYFRKRLNKDVLNEINELIANPQNNNKEDPPEPPADSGGSEDPNTPEKHENQGKLLLDATCTPADIHFPTDIWLLNRSREAAEDIVDEMHKHTPEKQKKPRTYRNCARKAYLNVDKKKHKTRQEIRKAIGQQLRYLRRDLAIIEKLSQQVGLNCLSRQMYHNLLVIQEIYRQQMKMHKKQVHAIEDRIVSVHMPFVRPIVRGKTHAEVEFGAKLSISIVDGYTYMEDLRFNAYNEGITLIDSVERYKTRFGFYPEAVIADKIYRNRDNLKFCKENGIRLSGPPLGRPCKNIEMRREQYRQERKDTKIRNAVEGKFGEGKRRYGWNRIMAHLQETSESVIALQILVMNLELRLRILLRHFFEAYFSRPEIAI